MKKFTIILITAILLSSCGVQMGNMNRLSEGMTKEQVAGVMGYPNRTLSVQYFSDGVQEILEYTTNYNEVYALEYWNNRLVGYEHLYDISGGYYGPTYNSGYYYYPSHPHYYDRPHTNPNIRPGGNTGRPGGNTGRPGGNTGRPGGNNERPGDNYPGAHTKPAPPPSSGGRPGGNDSGNNGNTSRPTTRPATTPPANNNNARPTTRPATNDNNNTRPTTRPATNSNNVNSRPETRPAKNENNARPSTRESDSSTNSNSGTTRPTGRTESK